MRALRLASAPVSIWGFSGRMSSFQFRSITGQVPRTRQAGHADGASKGKSGNRYSDAPALGRAATVMRNRRHVTNGGDGHAGGLQRAQRRLAAGAGTGDIDFQGAHTVL